MRQTTFIEPTEKSFWQNLKSGKFARMVKEQSRGEELSGPGEVYNVIKPMFADHPDIEKMYGIFLDNKNRVLSIQALFTGSLTSSAIYPREIIKEVLSLKAAGMVLSHNHPSGHTAPSIEDKQITRKVAMALAAIDVGLHDHIIVGDDYYSFSEHGLMKNITREFNRILNTDLSY